MSDRVTMRHPEQGENAATREVSREAFELNWKGKGFVEVQSGEQSAVDNPGAALAAARGQVTPESEPQPVDEDGNLIPTPDDDALPDPDVSTASAWSPTGE